MLSLRLVGCFFNHSTSVSSLVVGNLKIFSKRAMVRPMRIATQAIMKTKRKSELPVLSRFVLFFIIQGK